MTQKKATFKLCIVCTSAHASPVFLTKRTCPKCGGNKFRAPSCEEVSAYEAKNNRIAALFDKISKEIDL